MGADGEIYVGLLSSIGSKVSVGQPDQLIRKGIWMWIGEKQGQIGTREDKLEDKSRDDLWEVGTACYRVAHMPGPRPREVEGRDLVEAEVSGGLGAAPTNEVSLQINSNAYDFLQCSVPYIHFWNIKMVAPFTSLLCKYLLFYTLTQTQTGMGVLENTFPA